MPVFSGNRSEVMNACFSPFLMRIDLKSYNKALSIHYILKIPGKRPLQPNQLLQNIHSTMLLGHTDVKPLIPRWHGSKLLIISKYGLNCRSQLVGIPVQIVWRIEPFLETVITIKAIKRCLSNVSPYRYGTLCPFGANWKTTFSLAENLFSRNLFENLS